MPRKPQPKKEQIIVNVNGTPIKVTLHPPTGGRKSWYAYWKGLITSKSTGQSDKDKAIQAVEAMLSNGGQAPTVEEALLTDEEFERIQRHHFSRKTGLAAKERSAKSLQSALDAIAAFREITGLSPVTLAKPADCERFERIALTLPKLWRQVKLEARRDVAYYSEEQRAARKRANRPDPLDDAPRYSPNNILKWSRSLRAAFERANLNATRRKCVRSVVPEQKLLQSNPWNQYESIEAEPRAIRQFDKEELISFLDYFDSNWHGLTAISALAKVFLWSCGRRMEIATLEWTSLRTVKDEHHFSIVGKWGIKRWFRIPTGLYEELAALRLDEEVYVFAAHCAQLREFYLRNNEKGKARQVLKKLDPKNLANWFYKKIKAWSKELPNGHVTPHVFRKTSLQYARRGEDINHEVARDANVSASVMMTNYVQETDEELRAKSNRTYHRILSGLSPEVAARYGYQGTQVSPLEVRLQAAIAAKNWNLVAELSAELASARPESKVIENLP